MLHRARSLLGNYLMARIREIEGRVAKWPSGPAVIGTAPKGRTYDCTDHFARAASAGQKVANLVWEIIRLNAQRPTCFEGAGRGGNSRAARVPQKRLSSAKQEDSGESALPEILDGVDGPRSRHRCAKTWSLVNATRRGAVHGRD